MMRLHRVPPSPAVMSQLYADYLRVTGGANIRFTQYLASIGYTNPAQQFHGMDDASHSRLASRPDGNGEQGLEFIRIPTKQIQGLLHIKVLLIDFSDQPGSLPVSHYQQLLFSKDTHPTGSMRDFYREVTLGKVDITGTVHGWLRMPNVYSYYTNGESGTEWASYPRNAPRMAEDAINAAKQAGIEFESQLDVLNDGTVTALFIIHAGLGAETLNASIRGNHIWSHKWMMRRPIEVAPNLFASTYLTVPNDAKVGVCAHELGHLAFQWEDFYDPNYDEDGKEWDGSGSWDLMAGGSYNGNGNRPCHPAGLHKTQHNWINTTDVQSTGHYSLPPYTATSGAALRVVSSKYRNGQYLLLENRARTGFDSDLPGEGLLVWKVDETANMFAPDKPALLLVQADGRRQLEQPNDWNTGDAGDPFPGSADRHELTDRGTISTSFPDGEDSGIALKNIQRDPATGIISLDIEFAGDNIKTTDLISSELSPNLVIPDNKPDGVDSVLDIAQTGIARQIAVSVDISHSYIGDLQIQLVAPGGQKIMLHNKEGGSADDLHITWSSLTHMPLASLLGSHVKGAWKLHVADLAGSDQGVLTHWKLAIDIDQADPVIREQVKPNLAIPDADPAGIGSVIHVARSGSVRNLKLNLDISHTYIGDLRVELINPQGTRALLHNASGGGADNLVTTYDSSTTPALAPLIGQSVNGDWTLRVADLVGQDTGTLNSWGIQADLKSTSSQVTKKFSSVIAIPDDNAAGIGSSLNFNEQGTVQLAELSLDITHTYIGDLRVELIAPSGKRAVVHDRAGGRTKNLALQLNSATSELMATFVGEPLAGNWVLRVSDLAGEDTGSLNRWSLNMTYVE